MHKGGSHRRDKLDKWNVLDRLHGMDGRNLLRELQRLFFRKRNRLPTQTHSATNHGSVVWKFLVHCSRIQLRLECDNAVVDSPGHLLLRLLVLCDSCSHGSAKDFLPHGWAQGLTLLINRNSSRLLLCPGAWCERRARRCSIVGLCADLTSGSAEARRRRNAKRCRTRRTCSADAGPSRQRPTAVRRGGSLPRPLAEQEPMKLAIIALRHANPFAPIASWNPHDGS